MGACATSSSDCAQVFLEDAGFDWKILGPDVAEPDYVAWQCDQDAYACSGQKCSAQSILFAHENWAAAGAAYGLPSAVISRQEAVPGAQRVVQPIYDMRTCWPLVRRLAGLVKRW